MIAYRTSIKLYLNGTLSQTFTTSGWRYSGKAFLYTSNPWYAPAFANLADLSLVSYSDQLEPTLVKSATPQSAFVPFNYELSFNITPLATHPGFAYILHYSANQQDNSRIPAIWYVYNNQSILCVLNRFNQGTTQLYCQFSTSQSWSEGFTSKALPIGAKTFVSIIAYQNQIKLYLNGSFTQEYNTTGMRSFGQASFYMADPWHERAFALVDGYSMIPYKEQIVSGCDSVLLVLQCPKGQKLTKASIQYGRWDNTICPHSTVNAATLSKSRVFPLPTRCVGMETCQIGSWWWWSYTLSGEFGDLYPNVYKHFTASFTCA